MSRHPLIIAMDLEGVLVPEIWIAVAERTGIEELRLTTRDIPDYDQLMRGRLRLLRQHGLKLRDIQKVIATLSPLPGAVEFLASLRQRFQVIILSDTFYEFADPLMAKLDRPTLFCNFLEIDADGRIENYRLRQPDGKRHAVEALRGLNFEVVATGDSFNDTTMLQAAHRGILFRPSAAVQERFPQFPVASQYLQLRRLIDEFADGQPLP